MTGELSAVSSTAPRRRRARRMNSLVATTLVLSGCSPSPPPAPAGPAAPSSFAVSSGAPIRTSSPGAGSPSTPALAVTVHNAETLSAALAAARPGLTITLAPGAYRGKDIRSGNPSEPGRFFATVSGTAEAPVTVRGPRDAVIDGGGTGGGYGLHLVAANFWRLEGFTVSTASKGIVLDRSHHVRIDGVRVTDIGAEGVHFRSNSHDNLLTDSDVDHTGMRKPNFGEGVYIGSAVSNWSRYSGSAPDASDRNQVIGNRISATGAENIDIKEGSSGGTIRGNTLDGSDIAGQNSADSWIDVKGNDYLIAENHGTQSLLDGFQVHVQAEGWGERNTFEANTLDVRAAGVGIWLQNTAVGRGNVIRCSNVVSGAAAGDYATNHYQALSCVT